MTSKPKKTIEYLGKLEKAIADKYGEEAITNPRSLWDEEKEKDYIEQAKENAEKYYKSEEDEDVVEKDGIFVSKKLLNKSNAKGCPVCDKYLVDTRDSVFLLKWECCYKCFVQWVEDREDRWKTGWRPNKGKQNE